MQVINRCHSHTFVSVLVVSFLGGGMSVLGQDQQGGAEAEINIGSHQSVFTMSTPSDVDANIECKSDIAQVIWNVPYVESSCEEPSTIVCVAHHSDPSISQAIVDGWILRGGRIGPGTASFECSAKDGCGATRSKRWKVHVSDQQIIDVEVQLSPEMNSGEFSRAITFEFYIDCSSYPTSICQVLDFSSSSKLAASARASLKISKNNYKCVAAVDALHTLRACATPECFDGRWSAEWQGDPLKGGNWLIGGNLDDAKKGNNDRNIRTINIVDFAVLMAEIAVGSSYAPRGDTTCDTVYPHGDVNADGAVDILDFTFLREHFLATDCSCLPQPVDVGMGWVESDTKMSVEQMRKDGFADAAAAADLNHDGFVDLDDMKLFMEGVTPNSIKAKKRNGN